MLIFLTVTSVETISLMCTVGIYACLNGGIKFKFETNQKKEEKYCGIKTTLFNLKIYYK